MLKIYWICLLSFFIILGCDGVIFDKLKAQKALNLSYVETIIANLQYHKTKNGRLPETLTELSDYKNLEEIIASRKIYYKAEGFKDKSDKLWIVVLKDQKLHHIYFVGNLIENGIVKESMMSINSK